MHLVVHRDAAAVADAAADHILAHVRANPALRLGLATGHTFEPIYSALVARLAAMPTAVAAVRWIQLDEYLDLEDNDPRSFRAELQQRVFAPLGIAPRSCLTLRQTADPEREIARHADAVAGLGGLDLQLLGLGRNGHLAFNEPGSAATSQARVVALAETTRAAAARRFAPDAAPRRGMTLGLAEIAAAHAVLLVATGTAKAQALAEGLAEPPTPHCPLAALRAHPRLTILCDEAAASDVA